MASAVPAAEASAAACSRSRVSSLLRWSSSMYAPQAGYSGGTGFASSQVRLTWW